jgi:uncharacterized membrane protein YhaH (DUF805 family)
MKWYLKVLKNYAVFEGRARRSEYWFFALISTIISIALVVIGYRTGLDILDSLYSLAVLIPSLAVGVRRIHDVNKSGWFVIVPIYNLILFFTDGTQGPNRYGPDPKRPEFEEFLNEADPGLPQ